jgi:uncharacterized protein with von Willebrand factor type A (vWA) domain
VHRINTEADVIWVDGHSDYGHAFSVFNDRWGDQITSRASVLLLGDARNNYHASEAWVLGEIQRQARHVYWLNPEPKDYWGSGDSIVDEYAVHCDARWSSAGRSASSSGSWASWLDRRRRAGPPAGARRPRGPQSRA